VLLLALGGLARIAVGAHWPSDVFATYAVGLVWPAGLLRVIVGSPIHRNP
jgi:membrane-associated phospholipid phosphatase